jgi:integrase
MAKDIPSIKDPALQERSIRQFTHIMDGIELWQHLTHKQYANNTLVAFKNDWNRFLEFCIEINVCPLPTTPSTVRRYIQKMQLTRKLATLKRYIVTIGLMHRTHALLDPCLHSEIKVIMRQMRMDKHQDQQQAQGFHENHLIQLHSLLNDSEKIKDQRDLAIWSLMFEAMLKRSELAALTTDDIQIQDNHWYLTVKDDAILLSEFGQRSLQSWLICGQIDTGYLFRRIDKHSNIGEQPMDHSSIYRVFRRASELLNRPIDKIFSGQSPRVGAAKDLAKSGASVHEIQHQGRWKSPAMPAQYMGFNALSEQEMNKFKKFKHWEK